MNGTATLALLLDPESRPGIVVEIGDDVWVPGLRETERAGERAIAVGRMKL